MVTKCVELVECHHLARLRDTEIQRKDIEGHFRLRLATRTLKANMNLPRSDGQTVTLTFSLDIPEKAASTELLRHAGAKNWIDRLGPDQARLLMAHNPNSIMRETYYNTSSACPDGMQYDHLQKQPGIARPYKMSA
ncbi:uncharacterized protein J7T54_008019 [Emericellopsis cladophorae]|uniref:Uncharacterized protein n=1 Tax=Emericellopsis cladophorae TaxID=2686198 RepID=A0A9Q0BHM9_9HYPO|nr:uncharacterized protein J7T54_008019 [Emericellopsis cladophorae]KAI6784925.1 hypothetical protein J7T54_008019 [Emericellopsis cladophorae]